ncbi:DNA-binding transcriptional regulator, MerR family [Streptomyces sp. AmelKG-A3]|nr:DNA-binding transcriptional regulator, MerR family [Streptomyces sp. PalvLS-984]SDE35811.1 DNA-binding transcriptional regulator, MerR family [Streptomyces sp. AmelKG-A3]
MAERREHREYRMEELAERAGITVRTLRFYRERGLIQPPRREGRIAWYDDHHLARLRTITGLLERGHTLNGIADLAATFDSGRDVAEVLGLGEPTEETPVRLTPEQLADYFAGEATADNLAAAMELGYLGTDGDTLVHISRRLLDASSELVRTGVPLASVLSAGRLVREHADALAELCVRVLRAHTADTDQDQLRTLAHAVVDAELSMALDRRLRDKSADPGTARGEHTPAAGAPPVQERTPATEASPVQERTPAAGDGAQPDGTGTGPGPETDAP